jgi:hypothetical protein
VKQPTHVYKFRIDGIDLDFYIKARKDWARRLRRDAEILITRAEAIEGEADMLAEELVPVTDI